MNSLQEKIQYKNSLRNHLKLWLSSFNSILLEAYCWILLKILTSSNIEGNKNLFLLQAISTSDHIHIKAIHTTKLYIQHSYTRSLTLGTHLYTEASPWSAFDLNTKKHYPFAHKRYLPNDLHTNLRSLRGRVQQNGHSHRKNNPVMTPFLGISEWIDSQSLSEHFNQEILSWCQTRTLLTLAVLDAFRT